MKKFRDVLIIINCVILIWTFGIYPAYAAIQIENAKLELLREQAAQEDQQKYEDCVELYKENPYLWNPDDSGEKEGHTIESFYAVIYL